MRRPVFSVEFSDIYIGFFMSMSVFGSVFGTTSTASWGDLVDEEESENVAPRALPSSRAVTASDLQALAEDSRDGLNLLFKQVRRLAGQSLRGEGEQATTASVVFPRICGHDWDSDGSTRAFSGQPPTAANVSPTPFPIRPRLPRPIDHDLCSFGGDESRRPQYCALMCSGTLQCV